MHERQTIWHRGATLLTRMGDAVLRAQTRRAIAELPLDLRKDIGWPYYHEGTRPCCPIE
ncbi:MAG: hypothetical protein HC779_01645 [Phyllobacteriaceae bacterium]|nr:hypothetical protein [Phyllobacteriaceae bacterium]